MNEVKFSVFFSSNAAGEILENKAEIKVGCLSCLLGHIDTHRDAFFLLQHQFWGCSGAVVFTFADEMRDLSD